MATSGTSTYLEDYLETIATFPNEVRRHFELMRTLDKEAESVQRELAEAERRLMADTKRRQRESASAAADSTGHTELRAKRQRAAQLADEKVQIAEQAHDLAEIHLARLNVELVKFEEFLRTSGDFAVTNASPGEQVAARAGEEWILARVLEYNINTGVYLVSDEDDHNKSYSLPESSVVVLEGTRLNRGEEVFAVYPDTTSFYPAIVTSAPRRGTNSGGGPVFCTVQFQDDADESGATPDRSVPLRNVIKPPKEFDGL